MATNFGKTVGELKKDLEMLEDDCILYAGGLTFYRLKKRGEKLVQIEFQQQVYEDEKGEIFIQQFDLDDET